MYPSSTVASPISQDSPGSSFSPAFSLRSHGSGDLLTSLGPVLIFSPIRIMREDAVISVNREVLV